MVETTALDKLGKGVKIAEKHREKRKHEGFLADLFRGNMTLDTFFPWPERAQEDLEKEKAMMEELETILSQKVNAEEIDQKQEIPQELLEELSRKGFFALKVPTDFGGKGLSQTAYANIVELTASYSSAIVIIVSADNTIGCKYPVLRYGTPDQKARYLPELTKWPSGFCFTEDLVGSDPARMRTYAFRLRDANGDITGYEISGQKWYTTNSALAENVPLAKYLAVVARIVDSPDEVESSDIFGIFIIPTSAPGVTLGPRNVFCGMRGIYNANPKFEKVLAARDQLIGDEGEGFRIALEALNTGRIAIAAGCLGVAKQAHLISRWYAKRRVQWGKPIGKHEAIGSGMLAPNAANIFAMEAMTHYTSWLEDQGRDARLSAAALKVFASERSWTIIDNMMQIFGGRGYETYESLSRREETAPVERIWRDSRPNRIFEGSTQILSQWFMREGCNEMLKTGSVFFEKGKLAKKALVAGTFAAQYTKLILPKTFPYPQLPKKLRPHMEYAERTARKFGRMLILLSGRYREKLIAKQLTLERLFWIATELFAMAACISYAVYCEKKGNTKAVKRADMYCWQARLNIMKKLLELHHNNDTLAKEIADEILEGMHADIEQGIIPAVEDKKE